ncbi:energy transducer TonB [Pedobacter sp. AW31-3R]|uniref:energy transducer TonB n=1 Tax=Pedobacter sp. AW31-3R TaxID=3445781 RepID=UPI003F9F3EE4
MEIQFYFFWSSLSLAIFYFFYLIFLKSETFFLWNRIYLLSALCISLVLPLLDFSALIALPEMELMVLTFPAFGNGKLEIVAVNEFNWLGAIYWTGVVLSAALFFIKLLGVKKRMKLPVKGSAFSFWRTKVIDRELPGFVAIDAHENVHIKQFHTLDLLLIELMGIFFWFNPLIYCYRNSLMFIHEYLADEYAADFAESKKEYALLLFLHNFKAGSALINTFYNSSSLEARINMLQREKSNVYRKWKYALCMPLIALITVISAFSASDLGTEGRSKINKAANFPGGFEAFGKYVIKTARKISNKDGKVQVSFIVETNGEVTHEKVQNSLDAVSDEEALRVIKSSPKWEPALQNGKKVRSAYQVGINFVSGNQ